MKKRLWNKLEQVDKTRYILRTSVVVLLALVLGFLITYQLAYAAHHHTFREEITVPMIIGIIALMIEGMHLRNRLAKPSLLYHLAQYLMLGFFTVFLTNLGPAIYLFWLAWLMSTAVAFGHRGFIMAIVYMYIITTLTSIFNFSSHAQTLTESLASTSITVFVAVTIALVIHYTGASKRLLENAIRESDLRQNLLFATINTLGEAIISVDTKGLIRVYNPAAMILFDTNANLEGKRLTRFLNVVDDSKHSFDLWQYIKKENKGFTREDLGLVFPDGDKIDVAISCAPIIEKYHRGEHESVVKNAGYVLTVRDITKSKSLEEERDEFISVVSHELRTPATVAEGALSNIQYLVEQKIDPATLSEQLVVAHDQIRHLEQMINDIGTLSRAQRGVDLEQEAIDLQELFGKMSDQYQAKTQEKRLKFVTEIAPELTTVYSSPLYVQEILQNLIANAIKYTKKGSVKLVATAVAAGVAISVEDTGIGISKSDQKHVFKKFFRSEDFRTRETDGTGLGLYVVSKLANILKTKITVKSTLDKGSAFSFTLPANPTKATESTPPPSGVDEGVAG
jgi:PAS domain S-box-containing protein